MRNMYKLLKKIYKEIEMKTLTNEKTFVHYSRIRVTHSKPPVWQEGRQNLLFANIWSFNNRRTRQSSENLSKK